VVIILLAKSWILVWFSQSMLLQLANIVKFIVPSLTISILSVNGHQREVDTNYCYISILQLLSFVRGTSVQY